MRSSPSSLPAATIHSHDFTSFTTDSHQPWLTQPPSPRLTTQQSDNSFPPPAFSQQDFVLFPDSPVPRTTEPAQATSSTAPDRFSASALAGQIRSDRPQSYSASPYQNPRVRNSLGSSSAQSSPRFNSTGNINNLYAASTVPTSSPSHQSPPAPPPPSLF